MRRQRYQEQSNPLLYDVQHERDDDNQLSGARVRTREVHLLRHIGVKNRSKTKKTEFAIWCASQSQCVLLYLIR